MSRCTEHSRGFSPCPSPCSSWHRPRWQRPSAARPTRPHHPGLRRWHRRELPPGHDRLGAGRQRRQALRVRSCDRGHADRGHRVLGEPLGGAGRRPRGRVVPLRQPGYGVQRRGQRGELVPPERRDRVRRPRPGARLRDREWPRPGIADAWAQTWLSQVTAATGVRPIIYTTPKFWSTSMADTDWFARNGYSVLWIAHWTTRESARRSGRRLGRQRLDVLAALEHGHGARDQRPRRSRSLQRFVPAGVAVRALTASRPRPARLTGRPLLLAGVAAAFIVLTTTYPATDVVTIPGARLLLAWTPRSTGRTTRRSSRPTSTTWARHRT